MAIQKSDQLSDLTLACINGDLEKVKELTDAGCDLSLKLDGNLPPFLIAVLYDQVEILRYFITKEKIGFYEADPNGNNALHIAAKNGFIDAFNVLAQKIDINQENKKNQQGVLHVAICHGQLNFIEKIVSYPKLKLKSIASVEFQEKSFDFSPMQLAVVHGNTDIIKILAKEAKAKEDNFFVHHNTLGSILHLALEFNQITTFQFLIENYANDLPVPPGKDAIELKNNDGLTLFNLAAKLGHIDAVVFLKNKGADIFTQDYEGFSAMHWAVKSENEEMVCKLYELTGKKLFKLVDYDQNLPIHIARLEKNSLLENRIKCLIEHGNWTPRHEYENLVFQGGGAKGIAYVGALEAFERAGHSLEKIKRVAGASAGAITALLLALNYSPKEIKKLLDETDLEKLLLEGKSIDVGGFWGKINVIKTIYTLYYYEKGVCSGDAFRQWIENIVIREKLGKDYKEHMTFGDLADLIREGKPYKHLYMVGTHINSVSVGRQEIFSSEDEQMKDVIISDALRISMSIPIIFKPHKLHIRRHGKREKISDKLYVDGGIVNNYPISLFDNKKYQKITGGSNQPLIIFNRNTLGFSLLSKEELERFRGESANHIRGGFSLGWSVLSTIYANELAHFNEADRIRTIFIDNKGVGLTSFNLDNQQKQVLINSGISAVVEFSKKHWGHQHQLEDHERIPQIEIVRESERERSSFCSLNPAEFELLKNVKKQMKIFDKDAFFNVKKEVLEKIAKHQDSDKCTLLHDVVRNLSKSFNKKNERVSLEFAKILIENGADINHKNIGGNSPLNLLAKSKPNTCTRLANFLLSNETIDINSQNNNKDTALHQASFMLNESLVKMLIEKNACLIRNIVGISPLYPDRGRDIEFAKRIEFVFVSYVKKLETMLTDIEVLLTQSTNDAHINLLSDYKQFLLFHQIDNLVDVRQKYQDYRLVTLENINKPSNDQYGETYLHKATWGNAIGAGCHEEVITALITAGADISVKNKKGETPLYSGSGTDQGFAYRSEHVLLSVASWINDRVKKLNSETPKIFPSLLNSEEVFLSAAEKNQWELFKNRIDNLEMCSTLKNSILEDSFNKIMRFSDQDGNTLLHHAILNKSNSTIGFFIENGCSVNSINKNSETSLYLAVKNNNREGVSSLLLIYNADPEIPDKNGDTPLHIASWNIDNLAIIKLLINAGANFCSRNKKNQTVLFSNVGTNISFAYRLDYIMSSVFNALEDKILDCRKKIAHHAVQGNVNFNSQMRQSYSLCDVFSESQKENLAGVHSGIFCRLSLKDKKAFALSSKNNLLFFNRYVPERFRLTKNSMDFTANELVLRLKESVISGNLEEVKYLAMHGASLDADLTEDMTTSYGYKILHWAARYNRVDIIKYLARFIKDVDQRNYVGNTPLHVAVYYNNLAAAIALLENKGNANAVNKSIIFIHTGGYSPLHYAVCYSNLKMVNLLLSFQADINIKNDYKRTPLEEAKFMLTQNLAVDAARLNPIIYLLESLTAEKNSMLSHQ